MDGIVAPSSRRRTVAVWFVWILCVCVWTYGLLSSEPVKIKNAVLPEQAGYPAAKLLHICSYAFLTGFAAWLLPGHKLRYLPVVFLSFHAFATEYLQQFVPTRSGSLTDVGFNHLGIALGLLLTWWKWRKVSSQERLG